MAAYSKLFGILGTSLKGLPNPLKDCQYTSTVTAKVVVLPVVVPALKRSFGFRRSLLINQFYVLTGYF